MKKKSTWPKRISKNEVIKKISYVGVYSDYIDMTYNSIKIELDESVIYFGNSIQEHCFIWDIEEFGKNNIMSDLNCIIGSKFQRLYKYLDEGNSYYLIIETNKGPVNLKGYYENQLEIIGKKDEIEEIMESNGIKEVNLKVH